MAQIRSGAKGYDMEEALKAYFWQAGYFVVRGLPYQVDSEDITDIDLWLYERPAAMTRRRMIVDIKNKKTPKAAERIIWTRGLLSALGVDGAVVATTDNRPAIKRLGRSLGVQVLDGEAISKIGQSEKVKSSDSIPLEALNEIIKSVDLHRRSSQWRDRLNVARMSMLSGMGVQSANTNLAASAFFAEQVVSAQPHSLQAATALRLMYLTTALAAISLDFTIADQAFRSPDDRRQSIINAVRFGQSETVASTPIVRAAINLARQYVENGQTAAKQIEFGFFEDAKKIPAEIIADYLVRLPRNDAIFNVARELERASSLVEVPGFDDLSTEARSLLGVFLDFNTIPRERVALGWQLNASHEQTELQRKLNFVG